MRNDKDGRRLVLGSTEPKGNLLSGREAGTGLTGWKRRRGDIWKNPREEVWTTQERMAVHFGALQGSNGKEGPRVPVGVFEEDAKDKRVVLTNIFV